MALEIALKKIASDMMAAMMADLDPFFTEVSKVSKISVDELKNIFAQTQKDMKVTQKPKAAKSSKTTSETDVLCDFTMTGRSKRFGELCGTKVNTPGCTRCKRHLLSKSDDEKKPQPDKKDKKEKPAAKQAPDKQTPAPKKQNVVEAPNVVNAVEDAEDNTEAISPVKNEVGHYILQEKGIDFVIATADSVCGKSVKNKIEKLTKADIKIIEECGLSYDETAEPYVEDEENVEGDGENTEVDE